MDRQTSGSETRGGGSETDRSETRGGGSETDVLTGASSPASSHSTVSLCVCVCVCVCAVFSYMGMCLSVSRACVHAHTSLQNINTNTKHVYMVCVCVHAGLEHQQASEQRWQRLLQAQILKRLSSVSVYSKCTMALTFPIFFLEKSFLLQR